MTKRIGTSCGCVRQFEHVGARPAISCCVVHQTILRQRGQKSQRGNRAYGIPTLRPNSEA
jgi:hypothetical protein